MCVLALGEICRIQVLKESIFQRAVILCSLFLISCAPTKLEHQFDDKKEYVLAFGSCTDNPASPIWSSIREKKPDALILLGDNIYTLPDEWDRPEKIEERYAQLLKNPDFVGLRKTTPVYAIWDDHDFGPNNADGTFPFKDVARKAFRKYFRDGASQIPGLQESIADETTIGPLDILLTDGRWFRKRAGTTETPAVFSQDQLKWIATRLADPRRPFVVIASGGQILTTDKTTETLASYPHEMSFLIDAISRSPAHVFILSGDRHFAEIVSKKIGEKQVIDITSSPLTAGPRSVRQETSRVSSETTSESVGRVGDKNNFGIVRVLPDKGGYIARYQVYDSRGIELLEHAVRYAALNQ